MAESEKFDPAKYIKPLGNDQSGRKGYFLPVVAKIAWFRSDNPKGRIETKVIEHTIGDYAVIQVTATSDDDGVGVGLGMKFSKDFPQDYIQRAETTARGRALEALGYSLTEAADDAGDDYAPPVGGGKPPQGQPPRENQQQAPRQGTAERARTSTATQRPPAQAQGGSSQQTVLPATEAQLKAIFAIARGAQAMNEDEVQQRCQSLYGVAMSGLTRRQASEFIDTLKARQE